MHGQLIVAQFMRRQRGEPVWPGPPCKGIRKVVVGRLLDAERDVYRCAAGSPPLVIEVKLRQGAPRLTSLRKFLTCSQKPILTGLGFQEREHQHCVEPFIRRERKAQRSPLLATRLVPKSIQPSLAGEQVRSAPIVRMLVRPQPEQWKVVWPCGARVSQTFNLD